MAAVSTLNRRIVKLEQATGPMSGPTVILVTPLDQQAVKAVCMERELHRNDTETYEQFIDRAGDWAEGLPCEKWGGRVVKLVCVMGGAL